MEKLQYHEMADLFPLMSGDEYDLLVEDIRIHGQREPIWLYEGKILDGRNRYRACRELGILPITKAWEGDGPIYFIASANLHRRHLTPSQWAAVSVDIEAEIAKEIAEEKQAKNKAAALKREAEKRGKPLDEETKKQVTAILQEPGRLAAKEAAEITGGKTGRRQISEAKRIKKNAQDLFDEVKRGEKTVSQASREYKKRTFVPPPPISGKYRVFYADPPWEYANNFSGGNEEFQARWSVAETHYPTMGISQICDMGEDIKQASEDNAVLFLWSTSPILEDAFKVVKAWGYEYKAMFVWDKVFHNFGHYNSVRHEFLLIATRGSCLPDVPKLFDSVVVEERPKTHSEKPERFREIIDELYPHGERIELFARGNLPSSWSVWQGKDGWHEC